MFKIENQDINARQPMDLRYMKMLRNLLHLISSWPYKLLGEDVKPLPLRGTFYLFVEWAIVLVTGLIYVKTHINKLSFFEMGNTYVTVSLNVVGLQRITIFWFKSYRQAIKEFVLEVHLFHHRHKTEYSEHIYQYIYKICAVFVVAIHAETFFGVLLFNVMPFVNNVRHGMFNEEMPPDRQFEHSINYSLPFNYHTDLVGYIVIAIVNLILSYDCLLAFCGFDLVLSVIVFHVWGHLKILDHDLRTFPTPAELRATRGRPEDEMSYTKEENQRVRAMLKDIIDHHRHIMHFMTQASDAFGPMLCVYYMFHQVSGCILLLECSKMDPESIGRYAALTVTLNQLLVQLSIIVELLGTQSETLKDAVYSMPWECMDTSNRRTVLFLLYNVQEPIRLKPMGIVTVGVTTMASILKTSFSYFMFLRTFS